MKYWEFLIQKEGDQTWLPLETQQVEILEGRYRVVAHTDRANTSMEVKVTQLVTDEMPPRLRVRKRVSTTNESGLVVVMPFVNLQPGQWDLKCNSLDGAYGEPWKYAVQLQVFAHTEEDWSGEWPVPNDDETSASVSSVIVEGDREVEPDLVNQDLPLLQAQAELEANLPEEATKKAAEAPSYQVSLRQQAYLAHPQLPMKIVGNVSALAGTVVQETSQLWIRLQNPETAQVIMEASRPLSLARLPADFKVQIQLPAEVSTRVILGEVSLRTEASGVSVEGAASDGGEVLAATSFTISAGIAELLEAIANQDADSFSNAYEEEVISMPSLSPVTKTVTPAVGVVLPPKLDEIDYLFAPEAGAERNGHAQPSLPDFASADTAPNLLVDDAPDAVVSDSSTPQVSEPQISEPQVSSELRPPESPPSVERPAMVAQPAQFLGTSVEDSDIEADEIAAVLEDIDRNLSTDESDLDALEAPGVEAALPKVPAPVHLDQNLTPDQAEKRAANEAAREANRRQVSEKSPRQIEASLDFQALRLKDHFWNRLSDLTHQSHQEAAQLAERMKEAGVSKGQSDLFANPASRANSEVVIYREAEAREAEAREPDISDSNVSAHNISAHNVSAPSVDVTEGRREADVSQQPTSSRPFTPAAPPSPLVEKLLNSRGIKRPAIATGASVLSSSSDVSPQPAALQPDIDLENLPEMALPVISVPMGDLVAGDIITVTVRTRPSVYKPFIKLWMVDRQSRSLVIEPKLLTNMTPDALGDLETSTQMQIPMHCLDVQIAAIAIDMATQQESAKAIVNRHVVPTDQSLPLRDANV